MSSTSAETLGKPAKPSIWSRVKTKVEQPFHRHSSTSVVKRETAQQEAARRTFVPPPESRQRSSSLTSNMPAAVPLAPDVRSRVPVMAPSSTSLRQSLPSPLLPPLTPALSVDYQPGGTETSIERRTTGSSVLEPSNPSLTMAPEPVVQLEKIPRSVPVCSTPLVNLGASSSTMAPALRASGSSTFARPSDCALRSRRPSTTSYQLPVDSSPSRLRLSTPLALHESSPRIRLIPTPHDSPSEVDQRPRSARPTEDECKNSWMQHLKAVNSQVVHTKSLKRASIDKEAEARAESVADIYQIKNVREHAALAKEKERISPTWAQEEREIVPSQKILSPAELMASVSKEMERCSGAPPSSKLTESGSVVVHEENELSRPLLEPMEVSGVQKLAASGSASSSAVSRREGSRRRGGISKSDDIESKEAWSMSSPQLQADSPSIPAPETPSPRTARCCGSEGDL